MNHVVTAPLVVISNADKVSGDGYFYQDAIVPDGWNDARRTQLTKEGMISEVELDEEPEGPKPGSPAFILAEVGDDPAKAQAALDAEIEEKGDKARKGLVTSLEKVIGA